MYVSDEEPLANMQYRYQFYSAPFVWTHPELPSPFDGWGAYGPVTTTYNGKTYEVWLTYGGSDWRFYIRDTAGTV